MAFAAAWMDLEIIILNEVRQRRNIIFPCMWCMQVRKQQLELDMEQQTIPNRKRSMSRVYIVTLLI